MSERRTAEGRAPHPPPPESGKTEQTEDRGGQYQGCWDGEQVLWHQDWHLALRERPKCLLDLPADSSTGEGEWTARMHNATVERAMEGLWLTRARARMEIPAVSNKLLWDIQPHKELIPLGRPGKSSLGAVKVRREPKE